VVRNVCLMRLRHRGRETPSEQLELSAVGPDPEEIADGHQLGDWVWSARTN